MGSPSDVFTRKRVLGSASSTTPSTTCGSCLSVTRTRWRAFRRCLWRIPRHGHSSLIRSSCVRTYVRRNNNRLGAERQSLVRESRLLHLYFYGRRVAREGILPERLDARMRFFNAGERLHNRLKCCLVAARKRCGKLADVYPPNELCGAFEGERERGLRERPHGRAEGAR